MLVYAVRVEIEAAMAEAWHRWMIYTHIPEVMGTGYFRGHRFGEVIDPPPPAEKRVFLVLYEVAEPGHLQAYLEKEAPKLRAAYPPEFQGRFSAERWVWKMS
jgi:hypothetical protein